MKAALAAACLLIAIDGDTLHHCGDRIRLEGFDAPELRSCAHQKAVQAQDRLNALIAHHRRNGTLVLVYRLRRDGWPARGRWRRYLATLYVGGEDVGDVLIRGKLARPYKRGRRKPWC